MTIGRVLITILLALALIGCGSTYGLYRDNDVCDCGHTQIEHNADEESDHECLIEGCGCEWFYAVEVHHEHWPWD
jgi:hypothetical protein